MHDRLHGRLTKMGARLAPRAARRLARGNARTLARDAPRHLADRASGAEAAGRRYLMYVVIPLWFVPGVLDYLLHRRSRIEDTSGPGESLIHLVMMAEMGIPAWLGLLCEVNPGLIAAMGALAVAHNASSLLDQRTAVSGGRELTSAEMSVHSYLESLPFAALGTLCCLHWEELRDVARPGPGWWRLERKRNPLPAGYLAAVAAATLGLIVIPYAEEMIRCLSARADNQPARRRSRRTRRAGPKATSATPRE